MDRAYLNSARILVSSDSRAHLIRGFLAWVTYRSRAFHFMGGASRSDVSGTAGGTRRVFISQAAIKGEGGGDQSRLYKYNGNLLQFRPFSLEIVAGGTNKFISWN